MAGRSIEVRSTPWGRAQEARQYPDGIIAVSTAGHGGVKLPADLNRRVPAPLRRKGGWYEEDCEYAIAMLYFPASEAFAYGPDSGDPEKIEAKARKIVRQWFPDEYEAATGERVTAEESRKVAERERKEKHPDHYMARAAWGDWDADTPEGKVRVYAERNRDGHGLEFLVERDGYDPRTDLYHPSETPLSPTGDTLVWLREKGFEVNPDSDQPGRYWVSDPHGDRSDISYESERAAWEQVIAELPSYEEVEEFNMAP